ncbi:13480_t:CDS:2 [Dentiscutata heterogama]|uniref:13480_t:CDS:1 n=1 Tax=Dentiscutata heterogama TaxID=1316150 RepID=A0ACA9L0G4_9GLOM|nr:13480_t:CDS:2 [Dentiscutata heterogama]
MARFPNVVKFFNIASYLLFATLVSEPEFRFEYHNSYIHPNVFVFYFWNLIHWILGFFPVVPDKGLDSQSSPGVVIQICSVIALAFLDLVAMGYIYKCKGDLVGAGVIVITLLGIALQQDDIIVRWAALGLGIKTAILMANDYIGKYCRSEEQTPLLV